MSNQEKDIESRIEEAIIKQNIHLDNNDRIAYWLKHIDFQRFRSETDQRWVSGENWVRDVHIFSDDYEGFLQWKVIYGRLTYKMPIPIFNQLNIPFRISRVAWRNGLTEEEKHRFGIIPGRGSMIPLRPPEDEIWSLTGKEGLD